MSYYLDIEDMPIYNWKKCRNGQLEYTRIDLSKGNEAKDSKAWEAVYDTYIKAFGFGKEFNNYLKLQQRRIRKLREFAINGDRFIWNEIEQLNNELRSIQKKFDGKDSIDDSIIYVSKWMGGMIDEKKVTVKQFYTAQMKMIEEYEQKNMQNGKKN